MSAIGDVLFSSRGVPELDGYLRAKTDSLRHLVDRTPEGDFAAKSDNELAIYVAEQAKVNPLEVDFSAPITEVREVTVDVTGRFEYDMGDGRRVRVPGLRATKTIRFRGDSQLWRMKTNPWGMNPPRGEIHSESLMVGMEVPAAEGEAAKSYIDGCLASIPEYLERQNKQIQRHNEALLPQALSFVQQRRERLKQAEELRKKL